MGVDGVAVGRFVGVTEGEEDGLYVVGRMVGLGDGMPVGVYVDTTMEAAVNAPTRELSSSRPPLGTRFAPSDKEEPLRQLTLSVMTTVLPVLLFRVTCIFPCNLTD